MGVRKGTLLHDSPQLTILYCSVKRGHLSAENSGKPLGGRGFTPNPAGTAQSAPQTQ